MHIYTIIDWIFSICSIVGAILLGIYINGAACLIGIGLYFFYPLLTELIINCFSRQKDISISKYPLFPIIYHSSYNIRACGIEKFHPFDSCKYETVYNQIQEIIQESFQPIILPRKILLELGMSKWYLLKMCYSCYVSTLIEIPIFMLPGCFIRQCLLDPMLLATSGSIYGSLIALRFGWAINLSGGYHHANLNSGGGFCIFPDITLTIKYLQKYQNIKKVCIIDLDAHQGNGHERDFANDNNVLIIDFYNHYIYPQDYYARKKIGCDIKVDCETSDEEYCFLLKKHLNEYLHEFKPDFIIYNAGTDIMIGDPLGQMQISSEGIKQRDEIVFRIARNSNIPILMLLSGGYQKQNTFAIGESILQLINQQ